MLLVNVDRGQFAGDRVKNGFLNLARRRLVFKAELLDFLAFVANQPRNKRLLFFADICLYGPVLARIECLDLQLSLYDHAQRRALHTSGGQAALDFFPEKWREIEADEVVECPARLLGAHEVARYGARIFYRLFDRVFGYFVKYDAIYWLVVERFFLLEQFGQMPGNRLAFPVRVSREIECFGVFERLNDCVNVFLVSLDDLVLHRETLFGINRAFFGHEVANMAVRGHDIKVLAEVLADGLGLGR